MTARSLLSWAGIVCLLLPVGSLMAQGKRRGPANALPPTINAAVGSISTDQMLSMWDEEKLARDVYHQLLASSNLVVFRNIERAESQHMSALEQFIGADQRPKLSQLPEGKFLVPEHQALFAQLTKQGKLSPVEALRVGAKIEDMDIVDLQRLIAQTDNPQLKQLLSRLMNASMNHLRAFTRQLSQYGIAYQPEFLSIAQFQSIIQSPTNNGPGASAGGQSAGGQDMRGGQGRGRRRAG